MKLSKGSLVGAALFLLALSLILTNINSVISWGPGTNYRNYSVRATVNVTDSIPEILNITCNGGQAITLAAGSTQKVNCLVMVRDFNGGITLNGSDGSNVNATFHHELNKSIDPNDNNVHYMNSSCVVNGTPSGFFINFTCSFDVWYYANNGSWFVNTTIIDRHNNKNLTRNGRSSGQTISSLYALNVTDVIDYGDRAVGETSSAILANITNFGNMNINVSVYGYGGNNSAAGAGLAVICEQRNITIANERFATTAAAYGSMTPLSGSTQLIPGLVVAQQFDDVVPVTNATYWRLYINETSNPYGVCNGTVVFSAEAP